MRAWPFRAIPPLALLLLFLAARPVGAAPAIAITPPAGPLGTNFVARLSGFAPGEVIALRLTAAATPPRSLDLPAVTLDADGTYALTIATPLLQPGEYTLAALRQGAVVASAGFSVGPAPTPTRRPSPITAPPQRTPTPGSVPTATPPLPSPPVAGNGGYLPGLPNTGGGSPSGTPGVGAGLVALGAALVVCLVGGRAARRAARRAK